MIHLTQLQSDILALFGRRPANGFTHEELVAFYQDQTARGRLPRRSPQGIRSRCAELVKLGAVKPAIGVKRAMVTGGQAQVWVIAKN